MLAAGGLLDLTQQVVSGKVGVQFIFVLLYILLTVEPDN